jgi:hypothetical protein
MSELPKLILVQAIMHTPPEEENIPVKYLLFEVCRQKELETTEHKIWKWSTISSPQYMLSSGKWHSDGIEGISETYHHYRTSNIEEPKFYENRMKRTGNYINAPGIGNVYVYRMTKSNVVLPKHYYYVCAGSDIQKNWHICVESNNRLPRQVANVENLICKIPTHIFRVFVDSEIQNGQECPISMEKLTRETVASTRCGHLFQKEAITRALEQYKRCPTCRNKCSKEELQTW